MRADHGSYFVTTYKTNETIQYIRGKKKEKRKKRLWKIRKRKEQSKERN